MRGLRDKHRRSIPQNHLTGRRLPGYDVPKGDFSLETVESKINILVLYLQIERRSLTAAETQSIRGCRPHFSTFAISV
jgi:hypothetical protein